MDKTLATLDPEQLPAKVKRQLPALYDGGFVERAENMLAFGPLRISATVNAKIGPA